ncbi:hypothetical protein CWE13_03065 [Aliidiomarina shirensis]|uniref:Uncharacterized protein n=1 Tax=Aliidiomarina shirensis TaxID=1048642 RepID=A0A432WY38_9GAMM|nr:hypothetical protein [Aliidiomarina shirensis]RUO38641.1 hypothetical protein CWE13_03065 [Aliidiomarina shirensis]
MNRVEEFRLKHPEYFPTLKREGSYLLIAALITGVSVMLDYSSFGTGVSWFQRSGSILVILGVLCEGKYIAKIIQEDYVTMGTVSLQQKLAMHSGLAIALIGTLIWGYGDFISNHA